MEQYGYKKILGRIDKFQAALNILGSPKAKHFQLPLAFLLPLILLSSEHAKFIACLMVQGGKRRENKVKTEIRLN